MRHLQTCQLPLEPQEVAGDVIHNSLACLLAPNMWFQTDYGFDDYINSDHGFRWLPHKGDGFS